MPIRKGEDWGHTGPLAKGASIVSSDAELAEVLFGSVGGDLEVGLLAGDLARTVGARATTSALRSEADRTRLTIDAAEATIDGKNHMFVAHLVVRTRTWGGELTAVMNAAFHGSWNVAPRGHPNDGRLDLVEANLGVADRLKARSRLADGSHVPHPDISIRRVKSGSIEPSRRAQVYLDSRCLGPAATVSFRVLPDALTIVI